MSLYGFAAFCAVYLLKSSRWRDRSRRHLPSALNIPAIGNAAFGTSWW
jgi:hypothetical protein